MSSFLRFCLFLLIAAMAGQGACAAGTTQKLRVTDKAAAERLIAAGGRLVADYGAFQIIEVPRATTPGLDAAKLSQGVQARDDFDTILLNAGPVDTTAVPAAAKLSAQPLGATGGKRLHLVHFAGPVKPEWVDALRQTGVELVTYLPNNAYLVYGDATGI